MKSKAPMALIEQLIMIMVFALAAAICLRGFVMADQISQHSRDLDNAVLLAQNTAETLKACGDVDQAVKTLGGEITQMMWCSFYYEDLSPAPNRENAFYEVDTLPGYSGVDGLGQANVAVYRHDGNEPLFDLTVCWQEVA